MEKPNYATVITTVAVALLLLFFTTISAQISALDARLRCVEADIAAISAGLGISRHGSAGSHTPQSGAAMASPLEESR